MSRPVYFISDVHLKLYDTPLEAKKRLYLQDFLKEVRRRKARLYIVGDLFDFWFEYRYVIPRQFFSILRYLQETVEAGCDIQLLVGNHDYWFESFFPDELGIAVHREPVETKLAGKSFFITHADGILKKDSGYRFMRKILRNPLIISLFRGLHPTTAFGIAKYISGKSRHYTLRNPALMESERQELIEYGQGLMAKGYQYIITGHFHLPTIYKQGNCKLLNLGDWMRYFSFGYFDGRDLELCYWNKK